MKYDQVVRQYELSKDLMKIATADQRIFCQLFDFISLNKSGNIAVPLTEQGEKILIEAYANRIIWNFSISNIIGRIGKINEEGKRIVLFIQKEYHLE